MEYLQVGSQFLYSLGSLCVNWSGLISFIGGIFCVRAELVVRAISELTLVFH